MFFGKHALVQNARNQNAVLLLAVEDNVGAMFQTAQAGPNVVGFPAQFGMAGQGLTTRFQFGQIASGLGLAPGLQTVGSNFQQVRPSEP